MDEATTQKVLEILQALVEKGVPPDVLVALATEVANQAGGAAGAPQGQPGPGPAQGPQGPQAGQQEQQIAPEQKRELIDQVKQALSQGTSPEELEQQGVPIEIIEMAIRELQSEAQVA